MNSPAVDIREMLLADPNVDTDAYVPFVGMEPPMPFNCITIIDAAAYAPQLTMGNDSTYEYPSVQIRVRGVDYREAWGIISNIKTSLHGRANESWGDAFYTLINCLNGPMQLDWDDNQRVRLIANFDAQRRNC